jgi:RNA polymerase sigma-70 factor, ECF subfamily
LILKIRNANVDLGFGASDLSVGGIVPLLNHYYIDGTRSSPIVTESSRSDYEPLSATSSTLLDRVKARDEAAWRRLAKVYGHLVLYWCRCAGVPRQDCVDVSQEVFRAVAVNIDGFRRDQTGGTFRGWLRTITRSKVVDHFRRQHRQPTALGGTHAYEDFLAIPDSDPGSLLEAGDQEDAMLVSGALESIRNEFEDRTWQAFWRTTVDGQRTDAVAESLSMTPAAVRQAKSHILRRLREELSQLPEPEDLTV